MEYIDFFGGFDTGESFAEKIEAAVDFTKIYDIVGGLYSANNGRPDTDPVKRMFVGFFCPIILFPFTLRKKNSQNL